MMLNVGVIDAYRPKSMVAPFCARLTGYGAFAPHAILADLLKRQQERNGQAPLQEFASAVHAWQRV